LVHNQAFTTPADVTSFRFEFPTWIRNGNNEAISTFDDFYVREDLGLIVGPEVQPIAQEPVFPANYTNLIINGDFENLNMNNDGSYYEWALSELNNSNEPVDYNDLWNGNTRLQVTDKPDDELGGKWAHSGTSSFRFSTLDVPGANFDFPVELQANKTYRFNFWHRSPKWDDWGWLKVKIGEGDDSVVLWGQELKGPHNAWMNADLVFTTTEDTYLHLYTDEHGGWWNIYIDDLVLYEMSAAELAGPYAGRTNLFANGDFENESLGNDGETFEWPLASQYVQGVDFSDNYPVAYSDFWGTFVRLQDQQKGVDTGLQWAHSGTKALRFSYLGDGQEETNMDFRKELEPYKTYTLTFWFKSANYNDRGDFFIALGDTKLWGGQVGPTNINWTKETITFSTSPANNTLRMYTELSGWLNFYIDDIGLYEEPRFDPSQGKGDSYLFFGKSTGTQTADVEIEYVAVDNKGYTAIKGVNATPVKNLKVYSSEGKLTINTFAPATVQIYNVTGMRVAQLNVQTTASIALPQGIYIVKSGSEAVKVINK
jgi:hypothetical protein